MEQYALACDLGTGGCKSSLYSVEGECLDSLFKEYPTYYPEDSRHEQKPTEWWDAVRDSIRELMEGKPASVRDSVVGIGLSGHSLGLVPLDGEGRLLMDSVPIWSDSRPGDAETIPFFNNIPEDEWYMITGNGFPPALYTVFKILWLKNNQPDLFRNIDKVIGTKDYINFRLTGVVATDYSYASGSGVYSLKDWSYSQKLMDAAGLDAGQFPEIVASSEVLGSLTDNAAAELGLPTSVRVVAGGVDNSCMALGAGCYRPGRIYNSLGSSSWIAVSSENPLLHPETRPYVFTHVVPGQFASATAIFSAGSSYKWFAEILRGADEDFEYRLLDQEAEDVPAGSDNLLFNPSLAGGSSLDRSTAIRGAFLGLSLLHTRGHLVRSVMEGVGCGLKVALDALQDLTETDRVITVVGGGSKSPLWCQILADLFDADILKTSIDQQAAALGAAALVFVGCGLWDDYGNIDDLHEIQDQSSPNPDNRDVYERLLRLYRKASDILADFGEEMQS